MPELFELYWAHPVTDPTQLAWHNAVFTVFAGKAFALLALCFGVSFFIIMDRAASRGVDFTGRFVWRLVVLGVLGLLHGAWYRGDILEVLAVMGLVLVPFYRLKSNHKVLLCAVFFLLQPWMIMQIASALAGNVWANEPQAFWSGVTPEVYLTNGTLGKTIMANLQDGHHFKWLYMAESGRLSQFVGLSLIGMVLGRVGFFHTPERFARLRMLGLLASLAVLTALAFFSGPLGALVPAAKPISMPHTLWQSMLDGWFDLSIMFSLFFGFVTLYYGGTARALKVLAPAGRMTLSLYLLQSLIFVPVFYSFGLNLHTSMNQSTAVMLGLAAFIAQVILAHLWFKSFVYGPVEWCWRAATYLTLKVPFVKVPVQAELS